MKKINKKFIVLPIALGAAFVALGSSQAKAATTANTTVGLAMTDFASITATANITVTPTLAQIVAGSVTTSTNPITLTIDSTQGADIIFAGDGSDGTAGTLADADLELSSDNGTTWVGADDGVTNLYTSSAAQSAVAVPVKVRISNLGNYGVGTHNNTVTFTITDNS